MSDPFFLTVDQVGQLHQQSIEMFGGLHGLRDPRLFEGAVMHPRNVYYYAQGDLFDVAAAYCYHIAQAQAFIDGNKRTAVAAGLVFLEINGVSTDFDSMPLYEAMIAIAEKRMDKAELAALLRKLCGM